MPTYEYECDKCRGVFEIRQRISEPALTIHDGCGGAVRRLLSPAPFILKGDGWYVTDYPSDSRKKAMDSEKSAKTEKSESKSDAKSESKSDAKSESTSESKSDAKPGTSSTDTAKPATTTTSAGASSSST